MVILGLVSWWYSTGWLMLLQKVRARIGGVLGFFSVGQLAGSLFAPFRQISAGHVNGSLSVQLQAWGDRLFSRMVGFIVRLLLIFAGLVTVLAVAVFGLAVFMVWPLVPLAPIIGLLLMGAGI